MKTAAIERLVAALLVAVHAGLLGWALVGFAELNYAAMALVCAHQTLFVLTSPTRFRAMAIEYCEYAAILAFLFFSPYMRQRLA